MDETLFGVFIPYWEFVIRYNTDHTVENEIGTPFRFISEQWSTLTQCLSEMTILATVDVPSAVLIFETGCRLIGA